MTVVTYELSKYYVYHKKKNESSKIEILKPERYCKCQENMLYISLKKETKK